MNKVFVPVSCCGIGDILADDVDNDRGITLVSKNTIINQYILDKLIGIGISNVWTYLPARLSSDLRREVEHNNIKKNHKKVVLSIKRALNELATGGEVDYKEIFDASQLVLSTINESNSIVKCLTEIKTADESTYTHCVNVAFYSMLIAKWLNLPELKMHEVIQAGLLHDLGKIKISNEILNKSGKLTTDEFEEIKKHSSYGYELIKNISEFSAEVKNAVLMHHERIDGSGYPHGIDGNAINIYAKIVSIADVYDAMTSDRVYKKKSTPFDVFQAFLTTGVVIFDTIVLKTFLKNLPAYYTDTKVELNNGEVGEIVYIPPQDIACPVIRVDKRYLDLSNTNDLKVLKII